MPDVHVGLVVFGHTDCGDGCCNCLPWSYHTAHIVIIQWLLQTLFSLFHFAADENRYEGSWKVDKKNGPGKFFYLDKGQVYEGVWVDDIPKCGTVVDFGRDGAPDPTTYPIPEVRPLYFYELGH